MIELALVAAGATIATVCIFIGIYIGEHRD